MLYGFLAMVLPDGIACVRKRSKDDNSHYVSHIVSALEEAITGPILLVSPQKVMNVCRARG